MLKDAERWAHSVNKLAWPHLGDAMRKELIRRGYKP